MAYLRRVILYIAASLDGYIARENGDIDWLSGFQGSDEDYGYGSFMQTIDTVIMGRRTYEQVRGFDMDFPYKSEKCFVFSRSREGADEYAEYYGGLAERLVRELRSKSGKSIFLVGGAELIREFQEKRLIDEYVISIIPVLLGGGIRLFGDSGIEERLKLQGARSYGSGLVQIRYTS